MKLNSITWSGSLTIAILTLAGCKNQAQESPGFVKAALDSGIAIIQDLLPDDPDDPLPQGPERQLIQSYVKCVNSISNSLHEISGSYRSELRSFKFGPSCLEKNLEIGRLTIPQEQNCLKSIETSFSERKRDNSLDKVGRKYLASVIKIRNEIEKLSTVLQTGTCEQKKSQHRKFYRANRSFVRYDNELRQQLLQINRSQKLADLKTIRTSWGKTPYYYGRRANVVANRLMNEVFFELSKTRPNYSLIRKLTGRLDKSVSKFEDTVKKSKHPHEGPRFKNPEILVLYLTRVNKAAAELADMDPLRDRHSDLAEYRYLKLAAEYNALVNHTSNIEIVLP